MHNLHLFRCLAGGLLLVCITPAHAALSVDSSLHFSEQYSDNSGYSASNPQEEWTSTISPQINLSVTVLDAKLSLSYSPQYMYFAKKTHENQFRHQINLSLADDRAITLIPGYVTLQIQENMSQHIVDNSLAPTFENQTTVNNFSLTPQLKRRLGRHVNFTLGYRYQRTDAFNKQVNDSQQHTVSSDFQIGSGRMVGGLNVNRSWSFHSLSPDYTANGWILQAAVIPAATSKLSGHFGRRYFDMQGNVKVSGNLYGISWNQRLRENIDFALAHDVDVSDLNARLADRREHTPVEYETPGKKPPYEISVKGYKYMYYGIHGYYVGGDGYVYYYDGRALYLVVTLHPSLTGAVKTQRSNMSLSGQISKTHWSLSTYRQTSQALGTGSHTQTKALLASLQWAASARNSVNISANLTGNRFYNTGQADRLWIFGVSLSRRMRPTLSGNLDYNYQKKRSNMPGLEYDAHRVMASISKTW